MNSSTLYLDSLNPLHVTVGYGTLGTGGSLGYEGKRVVVHQQRYTHAFSTHPPARLRFDVGGRFTSFQSAVALNDDVVGSRVHADFFVLADGVQVAAASHVVAGESPRALCARIAGARTIELLVSTTRWELCHAVWLDPRVHDAPAPASIEFLTDPLNRAEITLPAPMPRAERCIATVVSPGFEPFLADMLGSLDMNGRCPEAQLVIFAVGSSEICDRIADKYNALIVRCKQRAPLSVTIKSVLYSVARVLDAGQFLCLDADLLILNELSPIFAGLETAPEGSILACREGNYQGRNSLASALQHVYRARPNDVAWILGRSEGEDHYPFVVNDGVFAGSKSALLALDGIIRAMPNATSWMDQCPRVCWWRNQFIFNLALARLNCGVELDDVYNVQLHVQDVQMHQSEHQPQADWRGRRVHGLHFCGVGRWKYPEQRGYFARGVAPRF